MISTPTTGLHSPTSAEHTALTRDENLNRMKATQFSITRAKAFGRPTSTATLLITGTNLNNKSLTYHH